VQLAFRDRPHWQADATGRAEQQTALSDRHEQVYAALLGRAVAAADVVTGLHPHSIDGVLEPAVAP
jgi:hypothetical protein